MVSEKTKIKRTLLSYGFAELGINAVEVFLRLHLLIFYTSRVGLDPSLAGIAIAVGIFWDAISDPLMGYVSDQTKTRWGRRRPYIFVGAILLSFTLVGLFLPELVQIPQSWKFIFLCLNYLLLNTAFTILSVPHAALSGDLVDTEKERNLLLGWRLFFGNFGALLGALIPGYFLTQKSLYPYFLSVGVIAGMLCLSSFVCFAFTREKKKSDADKNLELSFMSSLKIAAKNKQFLQLFFAFCIATLGLTLNSVLALYYYRQKLLFTESQIQMVLGLFLLVMSISIPLWVILARKFSKPKLISGSIFLMGLLGSLTYPFFEAQILWPVLWGASILGGILVSSVVLLDSMLVDIAEAETVRNKTSFYGVYFGLWKMGSKMVRAAAVFLAGLALSWVGIREGVQLSLDAESLNRLGWVFGPGVNLFFCLSALYIYFSKWEKNEASGN